MKANFFLSLLFTTALFSHNFIDWQHPDKIENAEFLVAYPRSGTNWTCALLQILCRKPIKNCNDPLDEKSAVTNRLDLELDYSQPILYRAHDANDKIHTINHSKNKLIVLVRNFKECIVRERKCTEHEFYEIVGKKGPDFQLYLKNITLYHSWKDPKTKLLIYYEDLIFKPRQTIEKLVNFLEIETDLDHFFDNYEYWKSEVITSYKTQHNTLPSSGGNQEIFHSKDFSKEGLRKLDNYLMKTHSLFWNEYLFRYKT